MLKIRCIQKVRNFNTNKILYYRIEDEHGRVNDVQPDELKNAIRNNSVTCTNLTLTSDNRLVDKQEKVKYNGKYYRYTIINKSDNKCIGGLFRAIEKVLKIINEEAEDGSDLAIEDYEDIDRIIGELEYILPFPSGLDKYKEMLFFYSEYGRQRVEERILRVKKMINDYGFDVKRIVIENPDSKCIVYSDQDQIAIVNKCGKK